MTPEQFITIQEEIKTTVATAIETNVNGKIRNLDKKIDEYITKDIAWKLEDKEWKDSAQPTVDFGKNAQGFGRTSKLLAMGAGVLLAIGGALQLIKNFFQ